MRILNIIKETMADGPGLRDSIYTAGCKHHCPGCHNPESWDMMGGEDVSIDEIIKELDNPFTNVTISGGDPFYQPKELEKLVLAIKEHYPKKTIWVYTGYTLKELMDLNDISVLNVLYNIDVIVDGPFKKELRDLSLLYRGSSNQRILANIGTDIISLTQTSIKWADITDDPNSFK